MIHTYSSATEFDRNLVLEITETTYPYKIYESYKGFLSEEQATYFAEWIKTIWYGYSPIVSVNGTTVNLSRAPSCD